MHYQGPVNYASVQLMSASYLLTNDKTYSPSDQETCVQLGWSRWSKICVQAVKIAIWLSIEWTKLNLCGRLVRLSIERNLALRNPSTETTYDLSIIYFTAITCFRLIHANGCLSLYQSCFVGSSACLLSCGSTRFWVKSLLFLSVIFAPCLEWRLQWIGPNF